MTFGTNVKTKAPITGPTSLAKWFLEESEFDAGSYLLILDSEDSSNIAVLDQFDPSGLCVGEFPANYNVIFVNYNKDNILDERANKLIGELFASVKNVIQDNIHVADMLYVDNKILSSYICHDSDCCPRDIYPSNVKVDLDETASV